MSRARWISRRLLPVSVLAAAALATGVGVSAWKQRLTEQEALAILNGEIATDVALLKAAADATAIAPWLERAHAERAYAEARCGDLNRARDELALAGSGDWAGRARAWILLREDRAPEALEAIAKTSFRQYDLEGIAYESRGPVPHTPGSFAQWEPTSGSSVVGMRARLEKSFQLNPGSVHLQIDRMLLARIATAELDDDRADELVGEMAVVPWPIDRRYTTTTRAEIAAIRSGSELGVEPWRTPAGGWMLDDSIAALDEVLIAHAAERARLELEVHRLFARDAFLERAVTRLRRALALSTTNGRPRLMALLLRARARKPETAAASGDLLEACWKKSGSHELATEAAQLALARGEPADARQWLDRQLAGGLELDLYRALEADVSGHHTTRAEFLGVGEAQGAESAVRAFALDRPWEARAFLERTKAPVELRAQALAREDPVGALSLLSPPLVVTRQTTPLIQAFAVVLDEQPAALARQLQEHGLSGDEAQTVAGLIDETRSALRKRELLP